MPHRSHDSKPLSRRPAQRAFTIVELMVSIAIIFVLITLAFIAFKKTRLVATRTQSLTSLRQLGAAYIAYSNDHEGRLIPGYTDQTIINIPSGTGGPPPPPSPNKLTIIAQYKNKYRLGREDSQSYVWRLAPWFDYQWKILTTDYRSNDLDSRFEQELGGGLPSDCYGPGTNGNGTAKIGLGLAPAYGLNSIFLGGDSYHGDAATKNLSPWNGPNGQNPNRIAAVRMSEIKSPSKMIVFAPTRFSGVPELANAQAAIKSAANLGYVELRPPHTLYNAAGNGGAGQWTNRFWTVSSNDDQYKGWAMPSAGAPGAPGGGPGSGGGSSGAMGLPFDRLADRNEHRIPLVHADGSVETEFLDRLDDDMSRWAPFMLSPD